MSDVIDKSHLPENKGWIGVDLDGTLAVYDHWRGGYHIGEPILSMVARVQKWLSEGKRVKIFTARVTDSPVNDDGSEHDVEKVRAIIQEWCIKHIGVPLAVTNVKDWHMTELWDDRAIQVRTNTGMVVNGNG